MSNNQILSKCCNSTITIGVFASECDMCGQSVRPEDGFPDSVLAYYNLVE